MAIVIPEQVTHEHLQAELRAVRLIAITRAAEVAKDVTDSRTEVAAIRESVARVERHTAMLAGDVAYLRRRLLPSTWGGMAIGIAVGFVLSGVLR